MSPASRRGAGLFRFEWRFESVSDRVLTGLRQVGRPQRAARHKLPGRPPLANLSHFALFECVEISHPPTGNGRWRASLAKQLTDG